MSKLRPVNRRRQAAREERRQLDAALSTPHATNSGGESGASRTAQAGAGSGLTVVTEGVTTKDGDENGAESYFWKVGYDLLAFRVYGRHHLADPGQGQACSAALQRLHAAKETAEANAKFAKAEPVVCRLLDADGDDPGLVLAVQATGANSMHYAGGNTAEGIQVACRAVGGWRETKGDLLVQFRAAWCIRHGYAEALALVRRIAAAVGIEEDRITLSSVDLKVDVPFEFTPDDVGRFGGHGRRNLDVRTRNSRFTGITFGGEACKGNIYDKRQDVRSLPLWSMHWAHLGITNDTPVWRVEFKLRRKYLKERHAVETADEWNDSVMRCVWNHLTEKYLYMKCEDDAHKERHDGGAVVIRLDPNWERVVTALPAPDRGILPYARRVLSENVVPQMKQAVGNIKSAVRGAGTVGFRGEVARLMQVAQTYAVDGAREWEAAAASSLDSLASRIRAGGFAPYSDVVKESVRLLADGLDRVPASSVAHYRPVPVLSG